MSDDKSRIRRRIVPLEKPSIKVKLGYFQDRSNISLPWGAPNGARDYTPSSLQSFSESQVTVDETHRGPPYRTGGPFQSMRIFTCDPFGGVYGSGTYERSDGLRRYVGGFHSPSNIKFGSGVSMNSPISWMEVNVANFPSLSDWGDKAYSKTKPNLEKASGFVALAEARDLPRMLRTTSKGFHETWKSLRGDMVSKQMQPKRTADHFLNLQFGWIPFINDVRKFYNAYDDSLAMIAKLRNQNGQWIRRRATLKDESTSTMLTSGTSVDIFPTSVFVSSLFPPWFPGNVARWELWEDLYEVITTSGKFRYYRPEFDVNRSDHMSLMQSMQRQFTLYGMRISPSNVYRATPWSWAADWFSNVGDYIHQVNDMLVDSVAMKYLFVMRHSVRVRRFVQYLPFSKGPAVSLQFNRIIDVKQREKGNSPYGFNLTLANLTPRQLAIATALGISRDFKISQSL